MVVWWRDGDGGDGGEAEWVMLFMKCTESECVPDCGKCKKSKKKVKKKKRSHTILYKV